jgi:hypothetical protein
VTTGVEGRGAGVEAQGLARESLMVVDQVGSVGRRWSGGTDRAAAALRARAGISGAPTRAGQPEVGGGTNAGGLDAGRGGVGRRGSGENYLRRSGGRMTTIGCAGKI